MEQGKRSIATSRNRETSDSEGRERPSSCRYIVHGLTREGKIRQMKVQHRYEIQQPQRYLNLFQNLLQYLFT